MSVSSALRQNDQVGDANTLGFIPPIPESGAYALSGEDSGIEEDTVPKEEIQRRLRVFLRSASPEAVADLFRQFFSHLGELLAANSPTDFQSAESYSLLVLAVRGGADGAWVIRYRNASAEPTAATRGLTGDVIEGEAALELAASTAAARAPRVEVRSFQDILDVALGHTSVVATLARRRITWSGDVPSGARRLKPALLRAANLLVRGLPTDSVPEEAQGTPPAAVRSALWMPDGASPCCPLCGQPWRVVLRQRHHCRACGTLVCGHCSTRRTNDGLRRCSRCVGVATPGTSPSSAASVSSGSSATAWSPYQSPLAARAQGSRASLSAPEPSAEPLNLPSAPEVDRLGVLLAQLERSLAADISGTINAKGPSAREKLLWERLQAAEQAASARTRPRWQPLLEASSRAGIRIVFCFALAAVSFAAGDVESGAGRFAGELCLYVLALAPRACILAYTIAAAYGVATARLTFAFAFGVTSVWHVPPTGSASGLGPSVQILPATPVYRALVSWAAKLQADPPIVWSVAAAHPIWTGTCILAASGVLFMGRLLRRLWMIYLTASVPISAYSICRHLSRYLGLSASRSEQMYGVLDKVMAPFLTRCFLCLGGLFVKLGQWAANVPAGVPVVMQENLKILVDDAPIDSQEHVRALFSREIEQSIEQAFEDFDFTPIASASIAQVHKATLRNPGGNGRKVAVKLQHENIDLDMRTDLTALTRIMRVVRWLGGENWAEMQSILQAWADAMEAELDFEHEVANLRQVRQGLASAGVQAIVPQEVEGLCGKRCFVMDFADGFRLTDMDRHVLHGVDRAALGARALHATACQLLDIGVCNSDPHTGNLLCQVKQDKALPVLLDFGNCIRLTEEQRLRYCRLVVGLSEASVTKVQDEMTGLGFLMNGMQASSRNLEFMLHMFRDTGTREQETKRSQDFFKLRKMQLEADYAKKGASTKKEKKKLRSEVARYPKRVPQEFVLFVRMMQLVHGLCTHLHLDTQLPFLKIFDEHARRVLMMTWPSAQRARSLVLPQAPDAENAGEDDVQQILRRRLRSCIARCCAERRGLGVQVAVRVGSTWALDECGGVFGAVDPRPMQRDTLVPLADLSRLPILLALCAEARSGRLSYGAPLVALLGGEPDEPGTPVFGARESMQLRHALSHRAIVAAGCPCPEGSEQCEERALEAKALLLRSAAGDLVDAPQMRARVLAALACAPAAEDGAHYLPLGAGCAAVAALEGAHGRNLHAVLQSLPGATSFAPREFNFRFASDEAPQATLSSALFEDVRQLKGATSAMNGEILPAHMKGSAKDSLVGTILEPAGGLLIDPALADAAVAAATKSAFCPDLGCSATARTLAAVLAEAQPIREVEPHGRIRACSREGPRKDGTPDMMRWLSPVPRAWDERGLELFSAQGNGEQDENGCGEKVAVGLKAAGGLLGIAVQWRAHHTCGTEPVTAVVLTNAVSLASIPATLLNEVSDCLQIPRLEL